MDVRATMRQLDDGSWVAATTDPHPLEATGTSRDGCLRELRGRLDEHRPRLLGTDVLIVEVIPRIAGVAEAAEVMGWDKRRVVTYLDRGRFPVPLQALASGRVWVRTDVEAFADAWRARRAGRSEPNP